MELKRIAHWESGTIPCEKCGKPVTLYFNGGELDQKECCGLEYRTEAVQIDLVISSREHTEEK